MEPVPKKRTTRRAAVKVAVDVPETTVKKTRSPKKPTAKAATVKKVTTKASEKTESVPIKKAVKRGIKSPFTAEVMAEVTETNVDKETVKMVTGPLSPRLREKLALYELWYQTEAPKYMEGTAKLFGYAFIVSGFLLAFSLMTKDTLRENSYLAALMCADDTCRVTAVPADTGEVPQTLPSVRFETVPTVLPGTDAEVTITVTNAASQQLFVLSEVTGLRTPVEQAGFDGVSTYTYRIPTTNLASGEYRIIVRAVAADGSATSEFSGATFTIPASTDAVGVVPESPASSTATTTSTSTDETVASSTEAVVEEPEPIVLGISTSTEETIPADIATPTSTEPIEQAAAKSIPQAEKINIEVTDGIIPQQYRVNITTTYEYSRIALTLRAINSTVPLILGSAAKTTSGWQYWLDANTLPVATYELQVEAIGDGEVKATDSVRFENVGVTADFRTTEDYTKKYSDADEAIRELTTASTSPYAGFADPRQNYLPDILETEGQATAMLLADKAELEPLLTRYASAAQSGDEVVEKLVRDELEAFTVRLLDTKQKSAEISVYTLESDLRVELEKVLAKIDAVSQFKKERTAAESSVDTDDDGIADYDEYLVYNTDPKNADTDEDGVIDGVEIGLGFDPTDAEAEAVVRPASPPKVLFKDTSSLGITTVTPLLLYEKDATTPLVYSEISGRGLPNSFVTLYVGDKPLVAIAKTNAEGAFSYTLSQELLDGGHDVYAALTDNTGAIVLLSPVFKFAKKGTAYTYPKDSAPAVTQAAAVAGADEVTLPFNLAAATGVVGFGLVLLLLAISLRQDRLKPAQ